MPNMTTDVLMTPQRSLTLCRPGGGPGLRAWDAADELLLQVADERLRTGQRVAIVDDGFGALTLGLADAAPEVVADSAVLPHALARNAAANGLASPAVANWQAPPPGPFDVVILRIPRQLDYLEYLLRWCNEVLAEDGLLLAGGMIKHLPDRSVDVFNRLVTTEAVLPARKKARVVVCRRGTSVLAGWDGLLRGFELPDAGLPVKGLPAVFSRERLDIGARQLLPWAVQAAKTLAPGARVLDLACGNGVQGLTVLSHRDDVFVLFADVSSQAVASAETNVRQALPAAQASFVCQDGTDASGEFDLVLLNPPFHDGGAVGDHIALKLFAQASRALRPGGQLLMVGNRHLGYHRSLRKSFRQVRQLAADPKFVVLAAAEPVSQRGGRS